MSGIPFDQLSEREEWAVRRSTLPRTPPENRELQDFLGYPTPRPHGSDLTVAVVLRILAARARGEHIA